jgi:hypothetical protein
VAGVGCDLVQQLSTFDPTFVPSQFDQGGNQWTTNLGGVDTQGIFYIPINSYNGDSQAEVVAFSPGDRNPAHAGQSGGPQIIGVVNTYNTPRGTVAPGQVSLVGHSLHALVSSGETGWVLMAANQQPMTTTSNTPIPATGPHPCTYYSLSGSNDCIAIQTNSYTNHSLATVTSVSGTAPTASIGATCLLNNFNNGLVGGTAMATLATANSWSGATISVVLYGTQATAAPTAAYATNNSSNCGFSSPTLVTVTTTISSVTGYEPYWFQNLINFKGDPGELHTSQIGDTAAFSASSGACNWFNHACEFMTLEAKNYGGTPGLSVFSRNAWSYEVALCSPTCGTAYYMQWTSGQGAGAQGQAVQAWWNATAGCGGSPDPYGDCLKADNNMSNGHGTYSNGVQSVTLNVPDWVVPSSVVGGQNAVPGDYQSIIGYPPSFFGLGVANEVPPPFTPCPYWMGTCTFAGWVSGVNMESISPPFDNVFGTPFASDAQTHPNSPGANASSWENKQAFDNVVETGMSSAPNFCRVIDGSSTCGTVTSGQLYRHRPGTVTDADDFFSQGTGSGCTPSPACEGTPISGGIGATIINRKILATAASCGDHPLIDVSGPSSTIGTGSGSAYTYCISRVAGECAASSVVGDIYANCPGENVSAGTNAVGCAGGNYHGGVPYLIGADICFQNITKVADSIIQYTAQYTDYYGVYTRSLAGATERLRGVNNFENNQNLPDNSWIMYRQEFLNLDRQTYWDLQLPPYPNPALDGYNRGTFIPVSVSYTPPGGTNNTVVDFGYQEYAQSGVPYCTTRLDTCEALATTIPSGYQPFKFASETPIGSTCSSACTIQIPAISQRALYYRLRYQNAGGVTLSTGPWVIQVTP